MERHQAMPLARWLPRILALVLVCWAQLLPARALADDPPATAAPAITPVAIVESDTRPAEITAEPATAATPAVAAPAAASPARVSSKPAKKRRGGIHPCMTPDPGFGHYDPWSRAPSMGQMIAPKVGGVRKDGGFDLILHFHGHEAVRKEFVKTSNGVVLVGIDLGIGSGAYSSGFASPQAFTRLVASVEAEMVKRSGNAKAHVRKLGLSAWSAGYGAIEQILRQTGGKNVDAVILLDSLHAGYENEAAKTLKVAQIEPFIAFAKRAAAGKTFMFMSHSSIIPPGYASTTEVTSYVISQLKGKPVKSKRQDVLGLDMIRKYDKGNFHVRGYDGDDKPDHCAHLGLMAAIMKSHILPRWKTPQSKAGSPKKAATVKTPAASKTKKGAATSKTTPAADKKTAPASSKKSAPTSDKKTVPAASKKTGAASKTKKTAARDRKKPKKKTKK